MNRSLITGGICVFLMVSLTGICIAEESSGYIMYIQGGEPSITKEPDGMMITLQDVVPYMSLGFETTKRLFPTSEVSYFHFPINAALIFSGTDGESVSLVQVTNLSFSNETKVLSMQVTPLEFYEGEMLKAYANDTVPIEKVTIEKQKSMNVYLGVDSHAPVNWNECQIDECMQECNRYVECNQDCKYDYWNYCMRQG